MFTPPIGTVQQTVVFPSARASALMSVQSHCGASCEPWLLLPMAAFRTRQTPPVASAAIPYTPAALQLAVSTASLGLSGLGSADNFTGKSRNK